LTKESIQRGFNHFKLKVGSDRADDLRRCRLIRSIIDDPQYYPTDGPDPARLPGSPALAGKNAGPAGAVLMIDANQVWDVQEAIDYVSSLAEIKPWCARIFCPSLLRRARVIKNARTRELTGMFVGRLGLGLLRSPPHRTIFLGMRPSAAR